jgi:hypothetical protein
MNREREREILFRLFSKNKFRKKSSNLKIQDGQDGLYSS